MFLAGCLTWIQASILINVLMKVEEQHNNLLERRQEGGTNVNITKRNQLK